MLVVSHLQDQAAQKAGETKEAAKVSRQKQNQPVADHITSLDSDELSQYSQFALCVPVTTSDYRTNL